MVYNTRDYRVFQIYLWSDILRTKHFGNWICFYPQVREWETRTVLGLLERANCRHWSGRMPSHYEGPGSMLEDFVSDR
jgi:hypothetical protein